MNSLYNLIANGNECSSIVKGIENGLGKQLLSGLSGTARAAFIAGVFENSSLPIVVVTHSLLQAQKLTEELECTMPKESVYLFSTNDMLVAEMSVSSPEILSERLQVLNHFASGGGGILVVSLAGMKKILPSKNMWKKKQIFLQLGTIINVIELARGLHELGYVRRNIVAGAGEFSVRGGIIDVFPLTEENPIRIEMFDDEVDSIRVFSIDNQRSLGNVEEVVIGAGTEIIVDREGLQNLGQLLQLKLKNYLQEINSNKKTAQLAKFIQSECELFATGERSTNMSRYAWGLPEYGSSILDYVPSNSLIIFDEINRIYELEKQLQEEEENYYLTLLEAGEILPGVVLTNDFHSIVDEKGGLKLYLTSFLQKVEGEEVENAVSCQSGEVPQFFERWDLLEKQLRSWIKEEYTIIFQGNSNEKVYKIQELLEHFNLYGNITSLSNIYKGKVQLVTGSLISGFEIARQKLVVITEREIFREQRKKKLMPKKVTNAERIQSYSELSIGDHVVHVNHGIGKYVGIETLLVDGIHKDFLHLKYLGDDKLYVPVDQIEFVQKYVGSSENAPKLYKLGGSEWKRVKSKVESSVEIIASELLELYASREMAKGFAFSPDTELQLQFEQAFPYVETDDQLRSIEEVKKDMEQDRPMDRLLCGDVGFGKTEVALRAAFKAVMDGKQVAFLVPTTILSQQHYTTLCKRLEEFPIKVGVLNRFRTVKEQKATIEGLRRGTIDIIVGTHRILSEDIVFANVGLLIVDEEQRFGVKHKERIKQLKTNVDVLTMTATPIPRTLHLSILGVRDLSIIETPPPNRFPIQTYVMEYHPKLVINIIERELARRGQVFFLHNRVSDIEMQASFLSVLVPEARVAYAHGQMSSAKLENIIYQFLQHEFDVLVSTTIIETGIDVPSVNTLIVNYADKMGLSQLYQLRGRVGRSDKMAYAYFMYQKGKELSEIAEKRLQSIKEFTKLGSGFKIAMRDLTIRGAGSILGAKQHGFIDAVGFDMYAHLLAKAIEVRKNKEVITKRKQQMEIDVKVNAYIPSEYIMSSNQKVEMYKAIRNIDTLEDILFVKEEMIDRFGDYPAEVELLFAIAELKVVGQIHKVESFTQKEKNNFVLLLSQEATNSLKGDLLIESLHSFGRNVKINTIDGKIKFTFLIDSKNFADLLKKIINFIKGFNNCYR